MGVPFATLTSKTAVSPTLIAKDVKSSCITWEWDASHAYCYAILDETGQAIARLGYGVGRFNETGLNAGAHYIRQLVAYTSDESLNPSQAVRVFTAPPHSDLIVHEYEPPAPIPSEHDGRYKIETPLKAFQSGVGDGLDLKIEKQSLEDYKETFSVNAVVDGIYTQEAKLYTKVPFAYRVRAHGRYNTPTKEGSVTFQTRAYDSARVSLDVIRYATQIVKIEMYVKFTVEYYTPIGSSIIVHVKELTTDPIVYELDQAENIIFNQTTGEVSLKPVDIKISNQTLKEMATAIVLRDPEIMAYADRLPYRIHTYEIYDDYVWSALDPFMAYTHGLPQRFEISGRGTLNATAKTTVQAEMEDACLYIEGYARAGLFVGRQTVEKETSSHLGQEQTLFSNNELINIRIANVDDDTLAYSGSLKNVHSTVGGTRVTGGNAENIELSLTVPPNGTVTDVPVLTVAFPEPLSSELVTYQLTDESFYKTLSFYKHIRGASPSVLNEYVYVTQIMACTENITFNSEHVSEGDYITVTGTSYEALVIESHTRDVIKDWTDVMPAPQSLPYSGVVNSGLASENGGKLDYYAIVPKYNTPDGLITDSVYYQVEFESLNDEESKVRVRFGEYGTSVGDSVGERLIFSSDAFTYGELRFSNRVADQTFKRLKIDGLKQKVFELDITRGAQLVSGVGEYDTYELTLTCDNNDVAIISAPNTVSFHDGVAPMTLTCQIQQNAVSKWSPRIHNGYYYLRQHEYFLPSEYVAEVEYAEDSDFTTEDLAIVLNASFKRSEAITTLNATFDAAHEYYSSAERHTDIELVQSFNGAHAMSYHVKAVPYIQAQDYNAYRPITYVSPVKTMEANIEEWGRLTWDETLEGDVERRAYIRAFNIQNNSWSDWMSVPYSGAYLPEGLPVTNMIQVKFEFDFKQEETPHTYDTVYSCSADFNAICEATQCQNITTTYDSIRCDNPLQAGVFVTRVIDRGHDVTSSIRATDSKSGGVRYYYAVSNDRKILEINPTWLEATADNFNPKGRYIRYKMELDRAQEVYEFALCVSGVTLSDCQAMVGNFKVDGRREGAYNYTLTNDTFTYSVTNDGTVQLLEESVTSLIEKVATNNGHAMQDLNEYTLFSGNKDFELQYHLTDPTEPMYIKSRSIVLEEYREPVVKFTNNKTTIQAVPQQFCPVIVEHPTLGPLKEVFDLAEVPEVNSFYCDVDLAHNQTTLTVFTTEPTTEALVSFETNDETNYRTLNHLSLNPVYNTLSSGFIYLSYDTVTPARIDVFANPVHFQSFRPEEVSVFVQVTDLHGSPAPGAYVEGVAPVGTLTTTNHRTDQNGVVVFRYRSPQGAGTETLVFTSPLADGTTIESSITMTISNFQQYRGVE